MAIIVIPILLRKSVAIHIIIPTTHITYFKISINDQWKQIRIISNNCRQFSIKNISGSAYLLLRAPDGGFDDVLFDYGLMDIPLDDSVNVILTLLEGLLLQIPHWCGSINTFELVVCWLDAHNDGFQPKASPFSTRDLI